MYFSFIVLKCLFVDNDNRVIYLYLSLFVGYTNNEEQSKKLNTLVGESHGCVLLDTIVPPQCVVICG